MTPLSPVHHTQQLHQPTQPTQPQEELDVDDEELLRLLDFEEKDEECIQMGSQAEEKHDKCISKDIQRFTADSTMISSEVENLFDYTQTSQRMTTVDPEPEISCSLREDCFQLTQEQSQSSSHTEEKPIQNSTICMNLTLDDLDDLIGEDMKDFL